MSLVHVVVLNPDRVAWTWSAIVYMALLVIADDPRARWAMIAAQACTLGIYFTKGTTMTHTLRTILVVLAVLLPMQGWAVDLDSPDDPNSGHHAGYSWAERHDINDPDDCHGCANCTSFREGCQEYAEEQQQQKREEEAEDEDEDEE